MLRAYGRFLPEATSAPVAMTNYLARQLDLPLVLFGEVPGRLATETELLQRIRDYLGWSLFDDHAQRRLVVRPQWRLISTVEVCARVCHTSVAEGNCVTVRWGGEQPEANPRSAGERTRFGEMSRRACD